MDTKLLKAFEKLLKDGYYAEAEEQLRQFIKLSPNDWQAKMLLATCCLFQQSKKTTLSENTEKTEVGLKKFFKKTSPEKSRRSFRYCGIAVFIIVLIAVVIGFGGTAILNPPALTPRQAKQPADKEKTPRQQAEERYCRKFGLSVDHVDPAKPHHPFWNTEYLPQTAIKICLICGRTKAAETTEAEQLAADRKDSKFHLGYSFPPKTGNAFPASNAVSNEQLLEQARNLLDEYQQLVKSGRITGKMTPCRHATEFRYAKQNSAPLKIRDRGRIDCYRNNGTKIAEIHFCDGFFFGPADFYSEDEKLWATVIMERGKCIRRYCYDQWHPRKFTEKDMKMLENSVQKIFDEFTELAAQKKLSCKIHRIFQITEKQQNQAGIGSERDSRKNMRYAYFCYRSNGSVIQKRIITDCRNRKIICGYFTLMNKEKNLIWEDIWEAGKSVKEIAYYPAVALDPHSDLYMHLCSSAKNICHPVSRNTTPSAAGKKPQTYRRSVLTAPIPAKLALTKQMKYAVISEVAYRDPNLLYRAIPACLGPLHAVYLQTYGVPSAGYSIRYKNNTVYADLFIYPAPKGHTEELVRKEVMKLAETAPLLIQRKIWTSSNIASQPLQIIKKWNFSKQIAALLEFQFSQAGKSIHSKLAAGIFLDHFVKIRFSSSDADLQKFNQSFEYFMKHLDLEFLCGGFVEMRPASHNPAAVGDW